MNTKLLANNELSSKKVLDKGRFVGINNCSKAVICMFFLLLINQSLFGQVAAWSPAGLTGYGPSPFTATTIAANATVGGLTRAAGVGTSGAAAANAWGGSMLAANATSASAITSNQFVSFSIEANPTFLVSLSTFSLNYRRSNTGPQSGTLQYTIGAGSYTDIATVAFSSSASGGASITPVSLSSIPGLQNVVSGSTINFRLVLFGNTGTGTWYVYGTGLSVAGSVVTTGTSAVMSNITPQSSGSIIQGNSNVVLSGFKLTPSASVDFTNVTVSTSGTATSTDLSNVRIYSDLDANGVISLGDVAITSGVAYSASIPFSLTTENGISTVKNYLIVADVEPVGTSTPGRTCIASVSNGGFTTTATVNSGSATGNSRTIISPPGSSTISAGLGLEPSVVSSINNTQGTASLNFDFVVTDDGILPATDALETQISNLIFTAGTGNTINNWTTLLAGAELTDGTNSAVISTIGTYTLTFAGISNSIGELGYIADNASKTYTLKVWLNTDLTSFRNTADSLRFVFSLLTDNITATGSQFQLGSEINSGSTNNRIDVVATSLKFIAQPPAVTAPNVAMATTVILYALDANGNRDLEFTEAIRITSSGSLVGTFVDSTAAYGISTFSNLVHSAIGYNLTLTAERASTLDFDVTSNLFSILNPTALTEVVFPQYAANGNTISARMPYVCRLGVSNLIPNATYRYLTSGNNNAGNMVVINNSPSSAGYIVGYTSNKSLAGTLMSGNENVTTARYGEFTTDANGYYEGWFSIVPTGNTVFTGGNTINITLTLNNGNGGTSAVTNVTTTSGITMLNTSTTAPRANPIRSTGNATPENMILLYDNELGTGRPISVTWAESDSLSLGLTTWYEGTVDAVAGSWGTYIPFALPDGIRRIEQRNVSTNTIVGCANTTSTGIWPTGPVSTINPSGGTASPLVLSATDVNFTCPILNTITTGTISATTFCSDNFGGSAVSVPFTSTLTFSSGNVYTAQLSDALGNFTSPTIIGTVTSVFNIDTIYGNIPNSTPSGNGYRIRVVSSAPSVVGSDNGVDLSITNGSLFYADLDQDLYGDDFNTIVACSIPFGYATVGGDCDDFNNLANPSITEICGNTIDDNCNGQIDEGCNVNVNVKAYFQGYYAGSGFMYPTLSFQGISADPNEMDTVYVQIRDQVDPSIIYISIPSVMNIQGNVSVSLPASYLGGSFYIALFHRNTVQTWSAAPVAFTTPIVTYDFTTAATQAYFDNQVEVETGVWAFYSGDINQDENIDITDQPIVETDVANFEFGYFGTDVNGDGNVDISDIPLVETNVGLFIFSAHP